MSISAAISNSSSIPITQAFDRIVKKYIPNERWIGKNNHYANDTIKKTDVATTANLKPKQLSEYIAASTILHCYDGWNYISRAVESIINNDISSAIHYMYYAELRGVMSFMAYQGVGIFNTRHFWFDMHSVCSLVEVQRNNYRITTHSLADKCLEEWAKLDTKKDSLFRLVRIKDKKLSQWINATNFTTRSGYSSEIVGRWLKDWSIDLKLKTDQDLRNEMSYRPHFEYSYLNSKDVAQKLNLIWKAIEPTELSRFNEIDLHLSRIAMERVYSKSTGKSPNNTTHRSQYIAYIDKAFDTIGESKSQVLYDFILRNREPSNHFIIEEAKKNLNDGNLNLQDPFPMLCRAILLMRLSSGAVYELLNDSALEKRNLKYWWETICINTGITNSPFDGDQTSMDLFADIKEAFETIFESADDENWRSLKTASLSFGNEFNVIKQFQRVCFWGIGL